MSLSSSFPVLFCCCLLGSEDFRTRERSHVYLANVGSLAIPYLLEMEKSEDLETSIRSKNLLDKHYRETASTKLKTYGPPFPWIKLPMDHPNRVAIVSYYLSLGKEKCKVYGPPSSWEEYQIATELLILDLLKDRKEQEIRELLLFMQREHEQWIPKNQSRYRNYVFEVPQWKFRP